MEQQHRLSEDQKDEFIEELNLTPEQIKKDMESMKSIAGFPIGDDDDILELSNPPYYTAYPNPYIKKFIEKFGTPYNAETDDYKREPFVGDVAVGKNEIEYNLHFYHTKVPPGAIKPLIEHYTSKKDIVLDVFSGSGMTGVASQKIGRNCILMDLSPASTYISHTNNIRSDKTILQKLWEDVYSEVHNEYGYLFETKINNSIKQIVYSVYSENVTCPSCKSKHVLYDIAVVDNKTQAKATCSNCGFSDKKDKFPRILSEGKKTYSLVKIYYKDGKNTEKKPDDSDRKITESINLNNIPYRLPNQKFMFKGKLWGDTWRKGVHLGITEVTDFFSPKMLIVLSAFFDKISKIKDKISRNNLYFILTSGMLRLSKLTRFMPEYEHRHVGPLSGTLYFPYFFEENNPFVFLTKKFNKLIKADNNNLQKEIIISNQSATDLNNIPNNSIDYIFVDPPFGDNLIYSELNFVMESWIRVYTNLKEEAIIAKSQQKDLSEFGTLMTNCFKNLFSKLKPNRWITVEFHNSQAGVWKSIQESIVKSGFIIAQVAVIDKKKGTTKQLSYSGTVKNDLMINAYKPSEKFRNIFLKKAGLNMEREFIKMHLDKLPVEPNTERAQQMLYSKLLAQYIQNGFEVRMDASEFYGMLKNNFVERDSFWFNQDQIAEYEKRTTLAEKSQEYEKEARKSKIYRKAGFSSILGITDEKTAIVWLAQFLRSAKSYSEISIEFNKNLLTSEDNIPELKQILEENFVTEDGKYRLPSVNEKKEREDVRGKRLTREFNEILQLAQSGKKIKEVRKEALLHGLMELYNKRDVDQIRIIGSKLDKKIIESDDDIYAIIDWAMTKGDSQ